MQPMPTAFPHENSVFAFFDINDAIAVEVSDADTIVAGAIYLNLGLTNGNDGACIVPASADSDNIITTEEQTKHAGKVNQNIAVAIVTVVSDAVSILYFTADM